VGKINTKGTALMNCGVLHDAKLLEYYTSTGDENAFRVLHDRHVNTLRGFLIRLFSRAAWEMAHIDIDDILQIVWTQVATKAHLYDSERPVTTWLCVIAKNTAISAWREQSRKKRGDNDSVYDLGWYNGADITMNLRNGQTTRDPSAGLVYQEQQQKMREEIEALPKPERDAILMVFFEGKTYKDTAKLIGVPANSVGHYLRRAKNKLGRKLADLGV
jgi:RNA polymerase sigma-70 factor (ECF subfamily)